MSALLRLFPLLFYDVALGGVWHRGTDAPDDREILLPPLPMIAAQLDAGFIEAAALLINCINYAIGSLRTTTTYTAHNTRPETRDPIPVLSSASAQVARQCLFST